MLILKAIILGIIEGITEWLPISSTGHLILVENFLDLKSKLGSDFFSMFEVVIQLGAILAVVVIFFQKLNPFSLKKDAKQKQNTWKLWSKVLVACIPAGVLGILLDDWLDKYLFNFITVSITLILYGIAFIVVENYNNKQNDGLDRGIKSLNSITYRAALVIGGFQVLALIPGTSRSGATILGGILIGCSRYVAAEFSFFLGIPVMFGASLLKLLKFFTKGNHMDIMQLSVLLVGFVVSFITSIIVIKFFLKFIKNHDFKPFGWYRIFLGIVLIAYFIFNNFVIG